jgi:S-adenosylmethionine/arginine decarboxylase-like enzyme
MVDAVGMQIMDGPHVKRCFDTGNEGVTGVVVLSTSHCSIHIWDQCAEPYLKMDLYSCRRFPIDIVLKMLRELDVRVCDYQIIDRNHRDETALLSGTMTRVDRGVVDFRTRQHSPNTVVRLWTAIARLLAWR